MSKPGVERAAGLLEHAAPVLMDWPGGLHAWMRSLRRPAGNGFGLAADFGPMLRRLEANLSDEALGAVADAVRGWLAGEWRTGTVKRRSFFHAGDVPTAGVSGARAAAWLGARTPTVARMVESGALRGEVRAAGRRRFVVVDAASLEAASAGAEARASAEQAALWLGVSAPQTTALRRSGVLPARRRHVEGRWRYRFRHEDIDELGRRLEERVAPPSGADGHGRIRLSDWPKLRKAKLPDLLRQVLTGATPCWRVPGAPADTPLLARFAVARSCVVAHRAPGGGDARADAGVVVRDAAAALGVAVRLIPALVAAGCLKTLQSGGADGRPIPKGALSALSVAQFGGAYELSRALAARFRTSTKRVVAHLRAAGVEPVVPPDAASGISAVWRKADLARHDLQALFGLADPPEASGRRC